MELKNGILEDERSLQAEKVFSYHFEHARRRCTGLFRAVRWAMSGQLSLFQERLPF